VPITESDPVAPINPYGCSKAFVEKVLEDLSIAKGLRYVSSDILTPQEHIPAHGSGNDTIRKRTSFPWCWKTAKGERESVVIHGTDYPTPDGTCIRDYIHVMDLVDAHIRALNTFSTAAPATRSIADMVMGTRSGRFLMSHER